MTQEHFYFLKDEYCEKYGTYGVMKNKENIDGKEHKRPCFYAIKDRADDIYWMIPISSKISKYQKILNQKLQKYPVYDGLEFGYVRGRRAAFLLQNLCPVTEKYIAEEYIDSNNNEPVVVNSNAIKNKIRKKANKLIQLTKQGKKVTITDASEIYRDLLEEN